MYLRLSLICLLLGWFNGQAVAEENVQIQINRLELQLEQQKEFSFEIHNQLRHLYLDIDANKSLAHCNAIFRNDPTNEYLLDCLSNWMKDGPERVSAFVALSIEHDDFPALAASCLIEAASLTDNSSLRKVWLEHIAAQDDPQLMKHQALVDQRLEQPDRE